ncbi:hypothetical protein NJR55_04835 [Idiomarina sp. M1R2S28]|uniref:J domain-containing protein n=1 Tax=Idiomarina rhizosphaerae TaxID=2961572 RepID=A0A9X2FUM7_9GAMM|nr:hypothetical protein [Idiomarina rhizosphaerae]MCP1338912.1 hypothetical protein [Idiomarina rhizosphaerae]
MSVWEALAIQQTLSVNEIKNAYAKQLKNCRPDIDPEGFQVLHRAYKEALRIAHEQNELNSKSSRDSEQVYIDNSKLVDEPLKVTENQEVEKTIGSVAYTEKLNQEYQNYTRIITEVLKNTKTRNDISQWKFLFKSDCILDPQFNEELGLFVIENILAINNDFQNLTRHKKRYSLPDATVREETVRYLDTIFYWRGKVQNLRYYFGDDDTVKILNMLDEYDQNIDEISAIKSVKGGEVKEKASQRVDEARAFSEARDALGELKNITYFTHGIGILVLLFSINTLMEKQVPSEIAFSSTFFILFIIQLVGVTIKNRYILYTMWPTSCLLLFFFPIGTFLGVRMGLCLSRGLKYFRYAR